MAFSKIASGGLDATLGDEARPNALPIIINGSMDVAQRSSSVTGVTTDGYKTCDRIRPSFTGGGIGTYTFIQETLTSGNAFANGFTKAFRLDCTTADASPAAGDYFYLAYKIEGNNLQAFKKGTTNAQKMTLAFWVKSNKTGTAQVNMNDQDNTRMCSGTYAISSADTWEHKVINIAADTTGAFGNDTGNSMQIEWWLDGGSNFQGGAVPTAWEARSNTDRGVSDLAIADNTANDFAITGIQLEVGEYSSTTLPPFQHESYGDNLARCQRYYYLHASGDNISLGRGGYYSSSQVGCSFEPPVTMRTSPTLEIASASNYYIVHRNGGNDACDDFALNDEATASSITFYNNTDMSGTAGHAIHATTNNASAKFALTAEL